MSKSILSINFGSSSIKFGLYTLESTGKLSPFSRGLLDLGDVGRLTIRGADGSVMVDRALAPDRSIEAGFRLLLEWIDEQPGAKSLIGTSHRIVHGGRDYSRPVRLTHEVIEALDTLTPLAPLHQPRSLMPIRAIGMLRPGLAQVGCFDTAFHATIEATAARIALPRRYEAEGVRRYGFHGLSYEYIAGRLPAISPGLEAKRTIVAHLGNGASLCAMRHGRSVDTTMGFSALDGLVMSTRCGSIDPGVLLHLLIERGMQPADLRTLLYRESGLLGVSGISGDVRTLLESGDERATEALDLFAFRAARETAALAGTLEGLDCLVFTAGIGENAPQIREAVCARLHWLGVRIDQRRNRAGEALISPPDSVVEVRIIPTDEESVLADHALALLS